MLRTAAVVTLTFGMALIGGRTSFADENATKLPPKDKLHVYLLIGQSNMAGRGEMQERDRPLHPRVLMLNQDNQWVPATDPLHFDKPKIAGVGPGSGFGPAMAEAHDGVTIGLIPAAVGGTPLSRWEAGGDLYEQAVRRAKAGLQHGTLQGIIWHQGEGDSGKLETANTYAERLGKMIAAIRQELDAPHAPFVVGKLGEFLPERVRYWKIVNQQLESIPNTVPHTACVESTGLKAKSDQIHFDAESSHEFGRRYAAAMLKLQQKAEKAP